MTFEPSSKVEDTSKKIEIDFYGIFNYKWYLESKRKVLENFFYLYPITRSLDVEICFINTSNTPYVIQVITTQVS